MSSNPAIDDGAHARRALCQEALDALVATHSQVTGALVSTVDGFEIAAALRPPLSAAKLAAMTSSLVALGEAVSAEGGVERCINVVIEAQSGRLLMMDIPGGTRTLLTVICDNSTTLGQVLWAARECSRDLGQRLAR